MLTDTMSHYIQFNAKLHELYTQIKKMKLTTCITLDKQNNVIESAKIIKKSITKRSADTNEIIFRMEDFISWSIHEHNINEIVINSDSIQLFDNNSYTVTFTK